MTGLSSVYGLVGMNSKCGVLSKNVTINILPPNPETLQQQCLPHNQTHSNTGQASGLKNKKQKQKNFQHVKWQTCTDDERYWLQPSEAIRGGWLVECYFTSTETVGLLGTGAQDVHLDFHTAPEFCSGGTSGSGVYAPCIYTHAR